MSKRNKGRYVYPALLGVTIFILGGCGGKGIDNVMAPTDNQAGVVTPFQNEDPEELPVFTPAQMGVGDSTPVATFSGGTSIADSGASFLDMATCASVACHKTTYDSFMETNHNLAWAKKEAMFITYAPTSPYCVQCHTVTGPYVDLNGNHTFEPALGEIAPFGLSPSETALTWGGQLGSATFTSVNDVPDEYKGIQCENCHGPASLHSGNKANIVAGYQAFTSQTCRYCHGQYDEWSKSAHSTSALWEEGVGEAGSTSCTPCHTGEGFVGYTEYLDTTTTHDVMTFIKGTTYGSTGYNTIVKGTAEGEAAHNVGCVACHDPHNKTEESQLRLPPTELCMTCHNDRKKVPGDSRAPHHNVQGRVLAGQGIVTDEGKMLWGSSKLICDSREFSATANVTDSCGTKKYIYSQATTIDPTMGETSCYNCHMYAYTNRTAGIEWLGHTWKPRTEACQTCHAGMDAANVIGSIQADFLVNYNALLARAELASPSSYGEDAATVTCAEFDSDADKKTLCQNAVFNLKYLDYDGSEGVHNKDLADAAFEYTDALLTELGY